MKKGLFAFGFALLLCASSCKKCYECKQYCAYCKSTSDTALIVKICSGDNMNRSRVDSLRFAHQANGFNCHLLEDDKKVCEGESKINTAINYYILQDYYCFPWK